MTNQAISPAIRNIVFDMGGILVGLDSARCIEAFERIGCTDVADYVRQHRTEDLFLEIERGLISVPAFCQRVRDLSHCDIADEKIVGAWNSLLTTVPEEKTACLVRLRLAGYRLFLLSNTNEMHWHRCEQLLRYGEWTAGRLFERVYLSNELHLVKPDTAIYAEVLRQSGLLPQETLFIDDREENCRGAAALGIHTLHDPRGDQWTRLVGDTLLEEPTLKS